MRCYLMDENAFALYLSMGSVRSYRRVAEAYQVSKRSVTKRARRERWAERVREIEQQLRVDDDRAFVQARRRVAKEHEAALRAIADRAIDALWGMPIARPKDALRVLEVVLALDRRDRTAARSADGADARGTR